MIQSKADYIFYLKADSVSRSAKNINSFFYRLFCNNNEIWEFQKTLRKLEYYSNCKKGMISKLYRVLLIERKFHKLSTKLGFTIPINVFGAGLSISHIGSIIVNEHAKVGVNCRIHPCVVIGSGLGFSDKAPSIGDNCYIGLGAKLYGKISIADRCVIGANAVVNKTFSQPESMIAGAPSKVISTIDIFNIVRPATYIVKPGVNIKQIEGLSAAEIKNIVDINNLHSIP
jgi:serine O-acetyltransferase